MGGSSVVYTAARGCHSLGSTSHPLVRTSEVPGGAGKGSESDCTGCVEWPVLGEGDLVPG